MIRGIYSAASGMLTSMRRMELVTNNLANAQTVGFKQDRSALSTFQEVMILQDGTVRVEDQPIAQLAIVEFTLDQPLKKVGTNQFAPRNEGDVPAAASQSAVRQSFVESSNIDMAGAQTTMLELQRAYEASQKMIQYQDELVGRAVNDIARPTS